MTQFTWFNSSLHDMRCKENSCQSSSILQFKKYSHLKSRFLHPISASCCHETAEKKFFPQMPVMLVLTEDQERVVQWVVCKLIYVAVQLALHCFLVIGTVQCILPDVPACNLFARKLNFLARLAVPLLSFKSCCWLYVVQQLSLTLFPLGLKAWNLAQKLVIWC